MMSDDFYRHDAAGKRRRNAGGSAAQTAAAGSTAVRRWSCSPRRCSPARGATQCERAEAEAFSVQMQTPSRASASRRCSRAPTTVTVSLPATTSAFASANIFARASGYIEKRDGRHRRPRQGRTVAGADRRPGARSPDRAGGGDARPAQCRRRSRRKPTTISHASPGTATARWSRKAGSPSSKGRRPADAQGAEGRR